MRGAIGSNPWHPLSHDNLNPVSSNIIGPLSRRILTTLIVIAAVGVMIRLGIWQLDRLEQRRAFNARVSKQLKEPALQLNDAILENEISATQLTGMEYREVIVFGVYDFDNQVALRNQVWNSRLGVDLIAPLKIEGTEEVVLIDRGWIPNEEKTADSWDPFNQPGTVEVRGMIRLSKAKPDFGSRIDPTPKPGKSLVVWNNVNVQGIENQLPYDVLPVYIQRGPDPSLPANLDAWSRDALPYGKLPEIELTEGPHLGYAIQWFTFAAIFTIGYSVLIYREKRTETVGR